MITQSTPEHSPLDAERIGLVTRAFGHDRVAVRIGDTEHPCTIPHSMAASRSEIDRVVIGDRLIVEQNGEGILRAADVLPRTSVIARQAAGRRAVPQPIAANATRLVAVMACAQPKPSWALLDRILVMAETAGVEPIIAITKSDLADMGPLREALAHYRAIPYDVHLVSLETGDGIPELTAALQGHVSLLLGKSGVGKSSLVNALVPAFEAATGAVGRKSKKGKHTTSSSALLPLPGGGFIGDTPGVRELALWDAAPSDIARGFREFRVHIEGCRFGARCSHVHEMSCTVRAAVESGDIDPRRYRSYLRMLGAPEDAARDLDRAPPAPSRRESRYDSHAPSTGFRCVHCEAPIPATDSGTRHRNHCPRCLWSLHLDLRPGDRAAACGGPMQPIAVWARDGEEWALVHRCTRCAVLTSNRIGPDDNTAALMALAARPLARPPFPLDAIADNGAASVSPRSNTGHSPWGSAHATPE